MGPPETELYRGARLQATLDWDASTHPDLTGTERAFLDASVAHEQDEARSLQKRVRDQARQNRRLRGLLIGVGATLLIAVVAGAVAVIQQRRADDAASRAHDERNAAVIERLVAESGRELDSHLDLAMLLAVEARRHRDTPDTQGALLTALTHNLSTERAQGFNFTNPTFFHHTNSSFVGFLSGPSRIEDDVALSDDGRIAATAGGAADGSGGLVIVYDTTTHREIGRITTQNEAGAADVSSDGRFVIASDGMAAYRYDVTTGRVDKVDLHALPSANKIAFDDTGSRFAVTTQRDGDTPWGVTLWDVATLSPVDLPLPAPASGWAIRVATDGTLAVLGADGTLSFVDAASGEVVRKVTLTQPAAVDWTHLQFLTFSSDGARVAANDVNQLVYVWDLGSGQLVGDAHQRPFYVDGLAFSPVSATTLAIASHAGTISFADVDTGVIGNPLRGHSAGESALAYSRDGHLLATTAGDGLVGLWADNGGDGLVVHPTGAGPVIAISAVRTRLLTAENGRVEIRDVARAGQAALPLQLPAGATASDGVNLHLSGYFSTDGTTMLSVSHDQPAVVFTADTQTGAVRWRMPDDPAFLAGGTDVGISADGRFVAVPGILPGQNFDADFPRGLRIWDTATGRLMAETTSDKIVPGSQFTSAPLFTSDGQFIDIAIQGDVVRLRTSDLSPMATGAATPTSQVQCDLAEIPGTNDLVGAEQGGRIWRWDMTTGRHVAAGKSHDTSSLCGVAASPDGRTIAAMHADLSVALFDAATLQPLGQPIPTGSVFTTARFTPDSKRLIGNGLFDSVQWDVDPDDWQAKACLAAGRNLTHDEWTNYLGSEPYRPSCDRWPSGA